MARIKVNGREIEFPPEDLTMGEMCDAEDHFGVMWDKPNRSGIRLTAAMLWIAIRRVDSSVTVDDVRKLDPAILRQLEGDDSPPAEEPGSSESSVSGESSSSNGSESSDSDPSPTGGPGLVTGSTSDPVTSAT